MKKLLFGSLALLVMTAGLFAQTSDPLQQFVDQVNAKWTLKDSSAIQQAINTRLQANASDVLALGTKAYFHIYAVNDLSQARTAIQAFNETVQTSSSSSAKEVAQQMKEEIFDIPLSESGVLSSSEQDQMYALFPEEFPMIKKVLSVARAVEPNQ